MRHALVLCAKDVRQRVRDRTAVTVGLLAPLVLTAVIGAALGGTRAIPRTAIAWVDLDATAASAFLARAIREEWPLEYADLVPVADPDAAEGSVLEGRYAASVVVPAGFGRALAAGEAPPALRLRTGRGFALGGRIATALVERATRRVAADGPRAGPGLASPALVEVRPPQGSLRQIDYYGPSLAVLFLFFQILGGMRAFGVEAMDGTLARLAATPARPREIVGGKILALALLGVLQLAVLYAASRFGFGVLWGPFPLVALLAASTVASAIGLMGAVIAVGGPGAGYVYGSLLLFVLSLLGGQFLPPDGLPDLFDDLARCTPNGQALRGFTDLAAAGANASLATIAEPLLFTATIGFAGIVFCARRLRGGTPVG